MSSDSSVSSNSKVSQFGLYRTIDARTEEFLRLSKKRQIRQGCACAAASTAITVTVVIVILLIFEYAIAVEWSLVQKKRDMNISYDITNTTNDTPFADRLDRSYFGFDQDYFERMPLLVNALQESNYIDPLIEMSRPLSKKRYNKTKPNPTTDTHQRNKIRRTSPRPFIFEYRSPTPLPFSNTYRSRKWLDNYRNTQRLQNIRQVIKYLEKTINAKVGDMHTKPSSSQTSIAFSGVYVEPMEDKTYDSDNKTHSLDMQQQGSEKVETFYSNHQSDPLFNFKPNSPGDVNLLADALWRFSPLTLPIHDTRPNIPMFKKITHSKNHCDRGKCNESGTSLDSKSVELLHNPTESSNEVLSTKPKSFSVMLNLFPYKSNRNSASEKQEVKTHPPVEKIYLTTSKPVRFQFRRKSSIPARRTYYRYKKPKYLIQKKKEMEESIKSKHSEITTNGPVLDKATKMIVHVNVYSPEDKTDINKKTDIVEPTTTTTIPSTFSRITEMPFELSSGQVEDYHDGSSGVIPVPEPTPPSLSHVTTLIPFFKTDTVTSDRNAWATNPPEVIQFNPEDAKIPDHYLSMMDTTTPLSTTEMNRRTSVENIENERETLIIRLRNDVTTTTSTEQVKTTTDEYEETTDEKTYVPQTNGHSRSFSAENNVFNTERNRKQKLEALVAGFRTYVPMYVEIKRNKTNSSEDD